MELPSTDQLRPIAERYGLKLIVFFGSQAQGHTHPGSDVDIAVLPKKPLAGSRRLRLWGELTKIFEADIDLTSLDRAEPLLLYRVACSGIPLYEGEKWAWENQKSYGCRRYWDSRKFFEAMERYVSRRAEEMRRNEQKQLQKLVADICSEIKALSPETDSNISYEPFEDVDATIRVYPPTEEVGELIDETIHRRTFDILLEEGYHISVLVFEPDGAHRPPKLEVAV